MEILMFTSSGIWYEPTDIQSSDISIHDIAHALSNLCRFGGHTSVFYSVAQHSVLVSRIVSQENALVGLMHDASEAYVCDLPRPIKRLEGMEKYRDLEREIQKKICLRFDLSYPFPEEVHHADGYMLVAEAHNLLPGNCIDPYLESTKRTAVDLETLPEINPVRPKKAEEMFLNRFIRLMSDRDVVVTSKKRHIELFN